MHAQCTPELKEVKYDKGSVEYPVSTVQERSGENTSEAKVTRRYISKPENHTKQFDMKLLKCHNRIRGK